MLKAFSVFDSKSESYLQPFFSQTTGTAIRSFESAANDHNHQFAAYAADYTLFEIGSFEENSGSYQSLKSHVNLGTALSYIHQQLPEVKP